jgi:putative oxidoreductase
VKFAVASARILLGLIFVFFGLNGFLNFIPAPPIPGPAGAFIGAMTVSHYVYFVSGVQVVAGLMLLTNQFVALALAMLAAVIANILAYHISMMPAGLPLPLVVTALWFVVALPLRAHFAPLLARQTP